MKTVCLIAEFLFLCSATSSAQQQELPDSSAMAPLESRLDEYVARLETESVQTKIGEVDFLIGSSTRPEVRDFIARKLYLHYFTSRLMGDEAVAIHITDEWFGSGKASMGSEFDLMNARVFATYNRQSLIGCRAPALALEAADGSYVELFNEGAALDRPAVLYFYDTDCSKCRIETMLLVNMLQDDNWAIDFHAIYTGEDMDKWVEYRKSRLTVEDGEKVRVHHLWDPGNVSGMAVKYGVLQTPRLLLVGKDGRIAGRNLDTPALRTLLEGICSEYEYGSDAADGFYDTVFSGFGPLSTDEEIASITSYIRQKTLEKGDSTGFKHMSGDLLFWMSRQRGPGWKKASGKLLDEAVFGMSELWTEPNDSLQVLGFAEVLKDLYSRAAEGSRLPAVKVNGKKLKRLKNHVILMVTDGCGICEGELAALESYLHESGRESLIINMDSLLRDDPDTAGLLFDSFDLTALPYITTTNRRGRVDGRYLTLLRD
ncbi:MAG: hypothetical protein HUJ94_02945 [Bacteroidales bacterium]|nr:hypothetical protein [Bacteroidales bacterium]